MCQQAIGDCQFEWVDKATKRIKCRNCGFEKNTGQEDLICIHNSCGAVKTQIINLPIPSQSQEMPPEPIKVELPPITTQAWNYGKAILKMAAAGGPQQCSLEQIHERLTTCNNCPYFIKKTAKNEDELIGQCSVCGCSCSSVSTNVFVNKAANKTEKCPHGKWEEVDKKYQVSN